MELPVSIHAPRRGSDLRPFAPQLHLKVSIHAPRRGSDTAWRLTTTLPQRFNPRSPQGERPSCALSIIRWTSFNPRSPQGERLDPSQSTAWVKRVSIHAPRRGSDVPYQRFHDRFYRFQSTLPAGGATSITPERHIDTHVSIHAPRRGSDARANDPTGAGS